MRMLLLDNGCVGGDYQQWAWISCHCQWWFVGCYYGPGQNIVFLFTQSTFFLIYVACMYPIHILVYACRYICMYGFRWCVHMYEYGNEWWCLKHLVFLIRMQFQWFGPSLMPKRQRKGWPSKLCGKEAQTTLLVLLYASTMHQLNQRVDRELFQTVFLSNQDQLENVCICTCTSKNPKYPILSWINR